MMKEIAIVLLLIALVIAVWQFNILESDFLNLNESLRIQGLAVIPQGGGTGAPAAAGYGSNNYGDDAFGQT